MLWSCRAPWTRRLLCVLACVGALGGSGCASDEEEVIPPPHCNPLSTESCLLPWPSSFYLASDASTRTGYRVSYPKAAMPKNKDGVVVDPSRYNRLDGFSIGSQLLVYFSSGVGAKGLPGVSDLARSTTSQSPIWLLEAKSGKRVPLFAELDANAKPDEVPGLIIRPQVPLAPNTRHVVLLRSVLVDAEGAPLAPPDPFRRLRDGLETASPTLEKERARIREVVELLVRQGAVREEMVLAWDFHTASRESLTQNVVTMVDSALARLPSTGPSYSGLKSVDYEAAQEPDVMRQIEGEVSVPSFLETDHVDSWLKLDARGQPVYRGEQKFPFVVNIPRCAATASGPLPVLIFGPGLFSAPKAETSKPDHRKLLGSLCMVEAAMHWRGLAEPDIPSIVQQVMLDFSKLPRITDPLQQAHVNYQVLVKLMQGPLLQEGAMQVGGKAVTDGKERYYLGISNGGNQGVAFAALARDIERVVLHVSGGWWSMMMQRSSNFQVFALMLETIYPAALDRLILVSLSQHLWDYTDPIVFAPHLRQSPLAGRAKKRVVMQESKDDDQLPNIATRAVARAIGLDALTPAIESVYGLPQVSGTRESGYTQWNTSPPTKPPGTNTPAPKPKEQDSAHQKLRTVPKCIEQMKRFFKPDGQLEHTCDGACDPQ